jgi:hypothetical protein
MKKTFLAFLIISQASFGQVNLDLGLRAYYPFDGNANDASGNHNDPVFNNATLTADRFGKPNSAYHFNGINNYMFIRNNPTINFDNQITLFVWIRPTGFYSDICHASSVISKGGGNYNPGNYALRFDDALYTKGNGCSDIPVDTKHQNFRGTGTVLTPYLPYINTNQWYPVVYTNDGTNAKLYVDCELKYSVVFPEKFTNSENLFFGKSDDPYFPFWLNGDLDEVRIYNRALNEKEIFTLCKNIGLQKPDTTKPVKPVVPVLKEPVLEKRSNELVKQIEVEHDSVSVTLYDNGIIDGDSVTLIYNDKILTQHLLLTDKPVTFNIKINPGNTRNELVMYAENLGSIPPNTALMVIYDGNKRYEINVSSSTTTNGAVSFKLRE